VGKDKDEHEYIQERMRFEYRTPEELEAAAKANHGKIREVCSQQNVSPALYKATREQCVLDVMAELGQNSVFNDIMDVVALSQIMRPELEITMEEGARTKDSGRAVAYFKHRPWAYENILEYIYKQITRNIYDLEFISHAGDTVFGATARRELKSNLIHEFTHFAMYAVFKNDCNPYFSSADPRVFSEVVLKTMRNLYDFYSPPMLGSRHTPSSELSYKGLAISLVNKVPESIQTFMRMFTKANIDPDTYVPYEPSTYNLEFVVRLPEILAQFDDKDTPVSNPRLYGCFEPLIAYWKDVITPEMRRYIDAHPKGALVNADRVYEENVLAHSGEHYLLLEGEKSPADTAMAIKANALIKAIREGNMQEFSSIINSAPDDRLPRLALAQAIEQNKVEVFVAALQLIKNPQYLKPIWTKAIKEGKSSMIAAGIVSANENSGELIASLFSTIKFGDTTFTYFLSALAQAGKAEVCEDILLPYSSAITLMQFLSEVSPKENPVLNKLLIKKLIESPSKDFKNLLIYNIDSVIERAKNDSLLFVALMDKGVDNSILIARLNDILPEMLKNPELKQQLFDAATMSHNAEILSKIQESEGVNIHIASSPEPPAASSTYVPNLPGMAVASIPEKPALPATGSQQSQLSSPEPATPDLLATAMLVQAVLGIKNPSPPPAEFVMAKVTDVPPMPEEPPVNWVEAVLADSMSHNTPHDWSSQEAPPLNESGGDMPDLVTVHAVEPKLKDLEKLKSKKPEKGDRLPTTSEDRDRGL